MAHFFKKHLTILLFLIVVCISCQENQAIDAQTIDDVAHIHFQMKGSIDHIKNDHVEPKVSIDTLEMNAHFYGLGLTNGLAEDVLINHGQLFTSKTDQEVSNTFPLLIYGHASQWKIQRLPQSISTLAKLSAFFNAQQFEAPFMFRLSGNIHEATIRTPDPKLPFTTYSNWENHLQTQNVPSQQATIIGFYMPHQEFKISFDDSPLHCHMMSNNQQYVGHLSQAEFGAMNLYLPLK